MSVDLKDIGARIKAARIKKELTQAELAEMLNVSSVHVSKIELGKTNFSVDILMRLTEIFQISADELLRTDIPGINIYYSAEIIDILDGCTQAEKKAMLGTLKNMKAAFQKK